MKHGGSGTPEATVFRLSLYLRELSELNEKGVKTVSSRRLAEMLRLTDAQVRKDLAYFGQFGVPGTGYRVEDLIGQLKRILGTDRMWNVAIIGCGNLGRALASYRGFRRQGFEIVAAFDADPRKVGSRIGDLAIRPVQEFPFAVVKQGIHIAILCVPSDQAQAVADQAVAAGIRGILNFAPTSLNVPKNVVENSVDLALRLEQLTFELRTKTGP